MGGVQRQFHTRPICVEADQSNRIVEGDARARDHGVHDPGSPASPEHREAVRDLRVFDVPLPRYGAASWRRAVRPPHDAAQ